LLAAILLAPACGDNEGGGGDSLDDFLPELPAPTGEAQSVFAGQVTSADELIAGDAAAGLVGDYFIRNSSASFIVQSEARVIGVVPQGGNLVDAVAVDADGNDVTEDHYGELSAIYLVGRTCEHETVEVIQDGSGGGAAVLRAAGKTNINDFINLKGIAVLSIPPEIDPDIGDDIECATTYILHPGSQTLEVYWSWYNPSEEFRVRGPYGTLGDSGGLTSVFAPDRGFEVAGIDALTTLAEGAALDYVVTQGPGVAYGLFPVYPEGAEAPNTEITIQGVSIYLYGAESLLDILNEDHWFFDLDPETGTMMSARVFVGTDGASVEKAFLDLRGLESAAVSGTVSYAGGSQVVGARVGFFEDVDSDGAIGEDDTVRTYFEPGSDGSFSGDIAPGNYLVRTDVLDTSRSDVQEVQVGASGATVTVELPDPVTFDYTIIDDETGNTVPGRITVIGNNPASPDKRLFLTNDRMSGVVRMIPAARGTSVDVGDGADPPLQVPAGGTYRVFATYGTEWSVDWVDMTPTAADDGTELEFRLRRVVPTPGYLSTEWHQHSIGSPDSAVSRAMRVATFVSEGVEMFAATDHDYVSDFQPIIEGLGFDRFVRAMPGVEVTPFVYGHFQAFPLNVDLDDASHGAIDWARGTAGFAMIPGEIWDTARSRGAEVIQINHPRATSNDFADMMQYFDRSGLFFDYDNRVIDGDPLMAPVPMEWLRLPEDGIWDDSFDALEVWNGHQMKDSNEDGIRENARLDIVMRDWFNFLSFGLEITPMGNSDTHKVVSDHTGMPRTMVRVASDGPDDIASAAIEDEVLDVLAGRSGTPRDVILTNGPHIEITANANATPIGSVIDGSGGNVDFTISVTAPDWAGFDTIELFVNNTPVREKKATWLQPATCFTSNDIGTLNEADPCVLAAIAPEAMTVELVEVAPGFDRYEATVNFSLEEADMALFNRDGASGSDGWVVVRVRGRRAIFPVMENGIDSDNIGALTTGDKAAMDAALMDIGVPATALTMPVYVDFDGGGYKAPFAP
jgi:hypothetical protein